MPGKFQVKCSNGKFCVGRLAPSVDDNKIHGSVKRVDNKTLFVPASIDENFDTLFSEFADKIIAMRLTIQKTNEVVEICENFVGACLESCENFLKNRDKKKRVLKI